MEKKIRIILERARDGVEPIEDLEQELLNSHNVSQQRELLKAYDKWDEENCYKLRYLNLKQRIDLFLRYFNSYQQPNKTK